MPETTTTEASSQAATSSQAELIAVSSIKIVHAHINHACTASFWTAVHNSLHPLTLPSRPLQPAGAKSRQEKLFKLFDAIVQSEIPHSDHAGTTFAATAVPVGIANQWHEWCISILFSALWALLHAMIMCGTVAGALNALRRETDRRDPSSSVVSVTAKRRFIAYLLLFGAFEEPISAFALGSGSGSNSSPEESLALRSGHRRLTYVDGWQDYMEYETLFSYGMDGLTTTTSLSVTYWYESLGTIPTEIGEKEGADTLHCTYRHLLRLSYLSQYCCCQYCLDAATCHCLTIATIVTITGLMTELTGVNLLSNMFTGKLSHHHFSI